MLASRGLSNPNLLHGHREGETGTLLLAIGVSLDRAIAAIQNVLADH